MRRLTVLIGAIDGNFHLIASGLINNGRVLPSPGVSFDLPSFSFHVPIFASSAAKHAAPAKKQSARVNPIVLIFIPPTSTDLQFPSMFLFKLTNGRTNFTIMLWRNRPVRKSLRSSNATQSLASLHRAFAALLEVEAKFRLLRYFLNPSFPPNRCFDRSDFL